METLEDHMNWRFVSDILLPLAAVFIVLTKVGRQIFLETIKHPLQTTVIQPDQNKAQIAKSQS